MSRRHRNQQIPPYVDNFGRPCWENPCGQNRPNPQLTATVQPAPIAQPVVIAQAQPVEPRSSRPVRVRRTGPLNTHPSVTAQAPQLPEVADTPTVGTRAQRLAQQLAEQRARLHRRVRHTAVAMLAVIGVVGSGAGAYAYWTAGSGSGGTGHATAGTITALTATATVSGTLIPDGSNHNVTVNITNPNSYAVTLKSVTGNGPATGSGGSCTTTGITFTDQNSLNNNLPGSNTTPVVFSNAAVMGIGAESGCQGATITIPVKITVQTP